jgi:cbb3-type cytochrome oxidase cytochrome c subunit
MEPDTGKGRETGTDWETGGAVMDVFLGCFCEAAWARAFRRATARFGTPSIASSSAFYHCRGVLIRGTNHLPGMLADRRGT